MNARADAAAMQVPPAAADPDALDTPAFLFDPQVVMAELAELRRRLGGPVVVSMKACPVLDLLMRCAHELGAGIEIASIGELNLTMGRLGVRRFVNTPAMDRKTMEAALAARAILVADSPGQLAQIDAVARDSAGRMRGSRAQVLLRVNAASLLDGRVAQADHFGMDVASVRAGIERLDREGSAVELLGLHVFAGSNSFRRSSVDLAMALDELVAELKASPAGRTIAMCLVGAALPGDWRNQSLDFEAYRRALAPLRARVEVLHEAGRAVFTRAGRFMTRIVATKQVNGEQIVVCDGGLAHCFLLAQTERFVKQWPLPLLVSTEPGRTATDAPVEYRVVGNSCSQSDTIGRLVSAIPPREGDRLVFQNCGAYHSYSPTGFLSLRGAHHYIVS